MTNTEIWLDEIISHIKSIKSDIWMVQEIMSLPNCNDCKNKDCEYKPRWGEHIRYNCPLHADRKTEPQTCEECEHWNDSEDGCADRHNCKDEPLTLAKNEPSLVKDLVKAFGEDGTWLERQGVYTLTLAEAKQRAVDIIESVMAKTEPQTERNE